MCLFLSQGRAQPFSAFNRAARNTLAMFGREDSEDWSEIEVWRIFIKSEKLTE